MVSECALTSHSSFPFFNAGPRSSYLFETAGTCCCDQCPLSCVKGLPRTLNVCCINTDLPRHVADGASVRVRRLKIFSAQFKPGPVHPIRLFVTLYIVWWCCERTHDVVSGTTVHTSPPPPSFVVLLRHVSVKFFFYYYYYHEGHEIRSLRTACVLLRVFVLALGMPFRRTSARLSTLSWVSFGWLLSASQPARFFRCS